jgi:ACS family sodium-dependent inorganic phosphate cotransporter
MSVAVLPIAAEQGWSSSTRGLVLASFYWGYIITQIPGGTPFFFAILLQRIS